MCRYASPAPPLQLESTSPSEGRHFDHVLMNARAVPEYAGGFTAETWY